ncbi:MAG: NGG1p interacting factor NIF3 [Parcubacteria group bacterium]
MDLREIYELAIDFGIKNDLRGGKEVIKKLERIKKQYDKLPMEEKGSFDQERLTNPFMDSTIHYDSGKKVKTVMAGIDIDAGELLIAKELGVDAVIAHHPVGKGLSYLDDVMHLQADVLAQYGVPINVAESLMKIRISEVSRSVNPSNHFKSPMAAQNLKINFLNVHTPADNAVATFLKNLIEKKDPEYVSEVIELLESVPEYKEAKKYGLGPTLFAGSKENRTGKIAVTEITGGTEGSPKMYEKMANAGIGTIIAMHQSEKHREAAEKAHINVVIAGHISSDNIGVNLFLDELEKKGIKVVPCSGLIRVSRNKKRK